MLFFSAKVAGVDLMNARDFTQYNPKQTLIWKKMQGRTFNQDYTATLVNREDYWVGAEEDTILVYRRDTNGI